MDIRLVAADPRIPPQLVRRGGPAGEGISPAGGSRAVPVGAQPTPALPVNIRRSTYEIRNNSAQVIERGYGPGLSFGQGIPINPGEMYSTTWRAYKGEVWLVGPAGSANLDVRVADESE